VVPAVARTHGKVLARFSPQTAPDAPELISAIEAATRPV
jgi:glutathione peroxidase-family protein